MCLIFFNTLGPNIALMQRLREVVWRSQTQTSLIFTNFERMRQCQVRTFLRYKMRLMSKSLNSSLLRFAKNFSNCREFSELFHHGFNCFASLFLPLWKLGNTFLVKRVPGQGLVQREAGKTVLYLLFIIKLISIIIIYYFKIIN